MGRELATQLLKPAQFSIGQAAHRRLTACCVSLTRDGKRMGTRSSSSIECKALLSWVTTGLMLSLGSIATSRAASAAEGAGSGPCEEVCLKGFMDTYLDALGKHDPSLVPTAPHYRYTENGAQIPLGEALWVTFNSLGKYRHDVADPGMGGIA